MVDHNFCEYVRSLIGDELGLIGANHIKDSRYGEGFDGTEVCFFSVADKIIAIDYSPRDGAACSITDAQSAELSQHKEWDGLWHLLKMDTDTETDEGLSAYLEMFPDGHDEFLKFIGTSLVRYFSNIESAANPR